MNIQNQLIQFEQRRAAIRNDVNLSPQGRQKAAQALDAEIAKFRVQALQDLKIRWDAWKGRARRNMEALQEATDKAAQSWNYARLNYAVQAVSNTIATAEDFTDIQQAYNAAKEAGDRHVWRAWIETGPAAVAAKFPREAAARTWVKQAAAELPNVLESDEIKTLKTEGETLTQEGQGLNSQIQQARAFYHPGGNVFASGPDEFQQITDGVNISQHIDGNLATVTSISFVD